jgi:hypothetical protein
MTDRAVRHPAWHKREVPLLELLDSEAGFGSFGPPAGGPPRCRAQDCGRVAGCPSRPASRQTPAPRAAAAATRRPRAARPRLGRAFGPTGVTPRVLGAGGGVAPPRIGCGSPASDARGSNPQFKEGRRRRRSEIAWRPSCRDPGSRTAGTPRSEAATSTTPAARTQPAAYSHPAQFAADKRFCRNHRGVSLCAGHSRTKEQLRTRPRRAHPGPRYLCDLLTVATKALRGDLLDSRSLSQSAIGRTTAASDVSANSQLDRK